MCIMYMQCSVHPHKYVYMMHADNAELMCMLILDTSQYWLVAISYISYIYWLYYVIYQATHLTRATQACMLHVTSVTAWAERRVRRTQCFVGVLIALLGIISNCLICLQVSGQHYVEQAMCSTWKPSKCNTKEDIQYWRLVLAVWARFSWLLNAVNLLQTHVTKAYLVCACLCHHWPCI